MPRWPLLSSYSYLNSPTSLLAVTESPPSRSDVFLHWRLCCLLSNWHFDRETRQAILIGSDWCGGKHGGRTWGQLTQCLYFECKWFFPSSICANRKNECHVFSRSTEARIAREKSNHAKLTEAMAGKKNGLLPNGAKLALAEFFPSPAFFFLVPSFRDDIENNAVFMMYGV